MSFEQMIGELVENAVRKVLLEVRGQLAPAGVEQPRPYREAAAFASCHVSTIQSWVKSGALPATGKGKLRRVLLSDVVKVLEGQRLAVAAPAVSKPKARAAEILAGMSNVRRIR